MNRLHRLNFGIAAVALAASTDSGLLVNDSLLPRFTAAGVLVEPGAVFPADELHTKDFVAKSTPVGNLTDEQIEALARQRGLIPTPQAPASEPSAAPVAPMTDPEAVKRLDEQQAEQADAAANVRPASEVVAENELSDEEKQRAADAAREARAADLRHQQSSTNPPDRNADGKPGGSRTKAEIAAELTDLKVEFDPNAKRDELGKLLDAELAKSKA